ncbi:DEAD/DEAH box helicase [Alistipes onderdonkii]|uniref:DEAD/DEAH box helicase n=1 Tax=Alistipes onderdonkii TaxID=328813 RepID=UPI0018AAD529|nr:DEAD/DEAH box helicase family protein [Alistipes onderdonkii]
MAGRKVFNTQDLVLKINKNSYNAIKYPIDDWSWYLDVLCRNREYQKEAIKTAIIYLTSTRYHSIEDLVKENYAENDQLRLRYNSEEEYLSKIQLANRLSACIDLATGTGKSYVMYGIAQIALGLGLVDKVLVLGPPSLTIERELMQKFSILSTDSALRNAIPASSRITTPTIINANTTIKNGCICIENINAVYSNTNSSIFDSLFNNGTRCLVLNDEIHHAYNKVSGNTLDSRYVKKWKEFLLDPSFNFKYILGFTGTSYIDNDYFNDVIYRYSLRTAIENKFVKGVKYVVENDDSNENEKFQKILQNHKRNKQLYSKLKPLTILITKDIRYAKQLKTRLVEFLANQGEGSEAYLDSHKVLIVTSDAAHKNNVLKLPFVDNLDEPVEWIISVAMLTEGWDVKNVFQIVPMEEKAFNSKLLIAQVLGRGLRIPSEYPDADVVVFNHDKWSKNIKDLVDEILEMEMKIRNSPILEGDRFKFHFQLYNVDYKKEKIEREIDKNTEVFNYKDYIAFVAETFEHKTETKYIKVGDREIAMTYQIEKEKFYVDDIVNKIYDEFQIRKLEGIILKLEETEYTNENLPTKKIIEKVIRNSMAKVGIVGDYIGVKNRNAVFSTFNTLLRKKPKSVLLTRNLNDIIQISTIEREHESISVLGLKNDATIFITGDYKDEIVIPDSLTSLEEIKDDESLPRYSFCENINSALFKTPIDIVFTVAKPERDFVKKLIERENAEKISSWIKSRNQSFYSIEYTIKKGSHTTYHPFNPDFFVKIDKDEYEYISVIEIKSDGDDSDENKQKKKFATEHFRTLNNRLKEKGINQIYLFNFLSPNNYNEYFTYLRDGRLLQGLFISELDNLLLKE